MKFSGNVLNGTKNKRLVFGSRLPDVFVYKITKKLMDGF